MQEQEHRQAFEQQFVLVIGKGGVGKTTLAASLALREAALGRNVLLAMCNARESLSASLNCAPIGDQLTQIEENFWAVNMTPEAALSEYGRLVLKSEMVYRALFENRVTQSVLNGTPGLHAWAMLGKAYYHSVNEMDARGKHRFDLVILDAPATGHGLEMLRVPKVLMDVAPPGPLRREAEKAIELLSDAKRSSVMLVTLPEEMPVRETIELEASLRNEFRYPISHVLINRRTPQLFGPLEKKWLSNLSNTERADEDLQELVRLGLVRLCLARNGRESLEQEAVDTLQTRLRSHLPDFIPIEFPNVLDRPIDRDILVQFAERIQPSPRKRDL